MAIRRIEVPIFGKDSVDSLLDCAAVLAIPFDAQIEARFIRPSAGDAALYDAGFGFASASLIDQIETEGVSAAAAARHKFESWRERHAARPLVTWSEEEGHTGAVVARRGCLSDVILLQRATAKDAAIDEPFEAAVYGAGRLAMVVDRTLPANFLDHVLIAWNESTEASRAVALQDVTAAQAPVAASHAPIGETLLKLADARGASLLVMGAYTHNRVRQMLFGGVTQHILTTPGLPALLAH